MDFSELNNSSGEANRRKNRLTLIAMFSVFVIPVLLAYLAFAFQWFSGASVNRGELLPEDKVTHIEDYDIRDLSGAPIHGKEFETLYWWILPLDQQRCDQECQKLNLFMLNQTYKGLGKEDSRIKMLLVSADADYQPSFNVPTAVADFVAAGIPAKSETRSGKQRTLEANYIYLVDPIGNIFIRYPLIKDESEAVTRSKDLRFDILHLFKYSRLG